MEEIEVKVLEIDVPTVSEKIEQIGAKKRFDGEVRSLFFDYPDGRIEAEGILRLRERGEKSFITLKKDISRDDAKRMEETEFYVSDFETAREFLLMLGLEQLHESRKERTAWEKGEILYVIDKYPGIPPLLEVEAPTIEELAVAVNELGYDMDDTVSWDAQSLLEHYGKTDW